MKVKLRCLILKEFRGQAHYLTERISKMFEMSQKDCMRIVKSGRVRAQHSTLRLQKIWKTSPKNHRFLIC